MASATDTPPEVREEIVAYLDGVAECTGLLVEGIRAYPDDLAGFEHTVTEVGRREAACDEQLRRLRVLLAPGGDPELLRLFLLVDDVPNRTESVLRTMESVRPTIPDRQFGDARRMAKMAAAATERLRGAIVDHVENPASADVDADVADVRVLEGQCDELKYGILDGLTPLSEPAAAVVPGVVRDLDEVADAVEDAADHLLYLSSRR